MRETRLSGLMSGDGKRSDANRPQATAPFLDSTGPTETEPTLLRFDTSILDHPCPFDELDLDELV